MLGLLIAWCTRLLVLVLIGTDVFGTFSVTTAHDTLRYFLPHKQP